MRRDKDREAFAWSHRQRDSIDTCEGENRKKTDRKWMHSGTVTLVPSTRF